MTNNTQTAVADQATAPVSPVLQTPTAAQPESGCCGGSACGV